MGDMEVHVADVRRRLAVPGELVRRLNMQDSGLTPCPSDLLSALARWPKRARPTAALIASLQRALRPGQTPEGGSTAVGSRTLSQAPWVGNRRATSPRRHRLWARAARPQEEAAEVLASLHETRGDVAAAAQLLSRAKSLRLFPLLRRHLPGADLGAAAALPQLVKLDAAQAIRLAAARLALGGSGALSFVV